LLNFCALYQSSHIWKAWTPNWISSFFSWFQSHWFLLYHYNHIIFATLPATSFDSLLHISKITSCTQLNTFSRSVITACRPAADQQFRVLLQSNSTCQVSSFSSL
jgi:hypothetical protein